MLRSLVGSEMCIRDRVSTQSTGKMMSLVMYLVRHGETDYNKKGKVQGHMAVPLNATGMRQARELGELLKQKFDAGRKHVAAVVASSVLRGKQTGEEIFEAFQPGSGEVDEANTDSPVKFVVDKRFAELHYGDLVDCLLADVGDTVKELKEVKWHQGGEQCDLDAKFPGEGGESFRQITARMTDAVRQMHREYVVAGRAEADSEQKVDEGTGRDVHVIVTTHSQCIEAMLVHLGAFTYRDALTRAKNKNCTMSQVTFDGSAFSVASVFQDLNPKCDKLDGVVTG
eukprot:TRINITY_DN37192_c0_g1_i1.p1 TRINITY_DN37192_c0_g1~~TRINITY_DN37192_c0_g1_i1.p1  ORF type:complete len:304 (-),score=99.42 TRINITY_DN37192_c0_g1_i1:38-889(-)